MIKFKNIINEIISEAPIDNLSMIGFDKDKDGKIKRGSFTRDSNDVKLITSANYADSLVKFFERTDHDFDIYIVNKPGLSKFSGLGEVSHNFVTSKKGLNLTPEQLKNGKINEDNITIFYVSNTGAEKRKFTPWILSHRLGHSINKIYAFEEYVKQFQQKICNILSEFYNINIKSKYLNQEDTKLLAYVYNQLGTMKSATNNKISRYYEFYYEIFTQYINSGGNVKLNPLPKQLIIPGGSYGRKNYKMFDSSKSYDDMIIEINGVENDVNTWMIDDILISCIGKVFVM